MASGPLPTLAAGSSSRKRKNAAAAERASAKLAGRPPAVFARAAPANFALQPVEDQPTRKLKPGELKLPKVLRDRAVLHLPEGAKYTQQRNLPPSAVPGKSALEALFEPKARAGEANVFKFGVDYDFDAGHSSNMGMELYGDRVKGPSRHRRRRLKQHENWTSLLRPGLLELYLERKYSQAAHTEVVHGVCACLPWRFLEVTLADWDKYEVIRIRICACSPAVEQLMARGYFPCAPLAPSMAFNMDLLVFICIHSVHVAPNATAWSQTLEAFWSRQGVPAKLQGRLRKRLGMALTWYQVLDNQADSYANRARERVLTVSPALSAEGTAADEDDRDTDGGDVDEHGRTAKRRRVEEDAATRTGVQEQPSSVPATAAEAELTVVANTSDSAGIAAGPAVTQEQEAIQRPSERLRRICPLCFGGPRPSLSFSEADVIICADGNFSQKRRKCASADPPLEYIDGRFVAVADVGAMEQELAEKRSGKPRRRRRRTNTSRVAEEVLDECERSFVAAQEKVTKASTTYYADTGLMALLCRHDCVLLVANMTTPGERQHYVLALLRQVAKELPSTWRIGLLYDIACQISRSIEKWGLLDELADRLVYAVSVFHAYGHQWACQVVFHPRKREGFGLTDGEGCERFWSSIRHLIPGLRVSGYNKRLFVLNTQMDAVGQAARWNCAHWLRRRYGEVVRRTDGATLIVAGCGIPEAELEEEWKSQVNAQLKKAPRQSSTGADKIIDEILVLMGEVDDLKREAKETQKALRKSHKMDAAQTEDLRRRQEAIHRESHNAGERIASLHESLGTEHCRRLESMRGDAYLRARVNARALRAAIRHALQAHKFERRKLERAYRNQILHAKDHAQTRDLVHRREKTITSQVKKYNAQVDHMALLARQGKKPTARTPLPRRLDSKQLFRLDVDDEIWQEDPGLGPQEEGDLPRWQTDEMVKRGIVGMLQKRRCDEERERVEAEVVALGTWWVEEKENLTRFKDHVAGWTGVAECAARRLLTHEKLRETWLIDLAPSARLRTLFADVHVARVEERDAVPVADLVDTLDEEDAEQAVNEGDVDSDDASDAYSSAYDEDEPLADLMDDLERAAGDLDPEDDVGEDSGSAAGAAGTLEAGVVEGGVTAPRGGKEVEEVKTPLQPVLLAAPARATTTTTADIIIDADTLSDVEGPVRPSKKSRARYVASTFFCDDLDLDRVVGRYEWLSGDGLAVFLMGRLLASGIEDIGIVHPRVLHDVEEYTRHAHEDEKTTQSYLAPVEKAMSNLVPPGRARKWLVFGHVPAPMHWTLLEIRWKEQEIRFFDSFARKGGYVTGLEKRARAFLRLCSKYFAVELDPTAFRWVDEARGVRQWNSWDCGPLAAADAASLLEGDVPSTKTEKDMAGWRETMAEEIRALQEPMKSKA